MGDRPEYIGFIRIVGWKNIDKKTGKPVITLQLSDRFKLMKNEEKIDEEF